jgi:hypothetical protein
LRGAKKDETGGMDDGGWFSGGERRVKKELSRVQARVFLVFGRSRPNIWVEHGCVLSNFKPIQNQITSDRYIKSIHV